MVESKQLQGWESERGGWQERHDPPASYQPGPATYYEPEPAAWAEEQEPRRAAPPRARRRAPTSRYFASEGLLERFAPGWGKRAALSVAQTHSPGARTLALFLGVILFGIGLSLLLGGGYTSIQGLRIPLARMGLPVTTQGFPTLLWWIWPLGVGFVEIVAKRFDGLRLLWWAAYVFDGTTTAIFLSTGLGSLLASYGRPTDVVQLGVASALLGLLIAVLAEQIFLSALCILRAAIKSS